MELKTWTPLWSNQETARHGSPPKKKGAPENQRRRTSRTFLATSPESTGVHMLEPRCLAHPTTSFPCGRNCPDRQTPRVAWTCPRKTRRWVCNRVAPRWASWCRWETSQTVSLPDSNGQHPSPTRRTGPLDAIHSKEPTHEALRGLPKSGQAAGAVDLGRQRPPTYPSQAQQSMPWTKLSRTWTDCRHI